MTLSCIRAHARDAFVRANVLTAVLLLLALLPPAHASPPDPTWIAGIYDDADLDEAVAAATNADTLIERGSLSDKWTLAQPLEPRDELLVEDAHLAIEDQGVRREVGDRGHEGGKAMRVVPIKRTS